MNFLPCTALIRSSNALSGASVAAGAAALLAPFCDSLDVSASSCADASVTVQNSAAIITRLHILFTGALRWRVWSSSPPVEWGSLKFDQGLHFGPSAVALPR